MSSDSESEWDEDAESEEEEMEEGTEEESEEEEEETEEEEEDEEEEVSEMGSDCIKWENERLCSFSLSLPAQTGNKERPKRGQQKASNRRRKKKKRKTMMNLFWLRKTSVHELCPPPLRPPQWPL